MTYGGEERRLSEGDRRDPDGWHFRKDIHAGHILTTFMILITIIAMFFDLTSEIHENTIINQRQDKERYEQDQRIEHRLDLITSDIREIRNAVVNEHRNKQH